MSNKYFQSIWTLIVRIFIGKGRSLNVKSNVRRGMLASNIEGAFSTVFFNLVSGAYLTGYALFIGLNDLHLGILGAIPLLATVPSLIGAHFTERIGSRKKFVLIFAVCSRFLWVLLIVLPFVDLSVTTKVYIFLFIFLVSALFGGMVGNVWQSWMSDLVPEKIRGRFYGQRNKILNVTSIFTMLLGGFVLDHFKDRGCEQYGYLVIFTIALLFAGLAAYMLSKQYEPPMHHSTSVNFWEKISAPLKDKEYVKIIYGFALFNLGIGISAAFFSAYMIKYLHLTYVQISLFTIFSLVVGIFWGPFWGHIADHSGLKPVMLFNLIIISSLPTIWVLVLSVGNWLLWILWALVGIGWSGFNIAYFNMPFAVSPKEGRSFYLGVLNITSGVSFFVSSIIGGFIALRFQSLDVHFGSLRIIHYHLLFLASSFMRFFSGIILLRIQEVRDKGLIYMIQFTSNIFYTKLLTARKVLFFPEKDKK